MAHRGFLANLLDALKGLFGPGPAVPVHWPTQRTASSTPGLAVLHAGFEQPAVAPEAPTRDDPPVVRAVPALAPAMPPAPSEAVEAFVATVRHLPLFSGTAMQLMRSVGQEDIQSGELVRLISTDAGLVAHLLRIVNSPFYGLPNRVSTVSDAVAVLGFDQVRRTISAAVLKRPLMSYLHDTAVVRAFWRHELLCAAMARHLALQNGLDGEVAYMAGLMHEIGRLALLIQHPHLTDTLLRVEGDDDQLGIDREYAHFGFDHAQVGGALLARWGLPHPIVQAAYDHGNDTEPATPMSAMIWRANLLTHELTDDANDHDLEQPWMVAIGLSVDARRRMLDEIRALEGEQH